MRVNVPPIKSQGIKTKLVPWINGIIPHGFGGRWIEPFMGTGVVAFNLAPKHALLCDTNPHLIRFYQAISDGEVSPEGVRDYLNLEGAKLLEDGGAHYYEIRARFNAEHRPLDFLFLNRSGFNGMIRFNRKGGFNIPFCKKPRRFAQAYVTKIVNQVQYVSRLLKINDFVFQCQAFDCTIASAQSGDLIYCDPPYIDRHVDYYNSWNEDQERALFTSLSQTPSLFILSTWHHNDYRNNEYIDTLWRDFHILTREHFYHVGGSENHRNAVVEAILTNYDPPVDQQEDRDQEQLTLLEREAS